MEWGCGRRFARVVSLGRHFRSEVGRVCIRPVVETEAAQTDGGARYLEAPGKHNTEFPSAIVAQYPSLAIVDWGSSIDVGASVDVLGYLSDWDAPIPSSPRPLQTPSVSTYPHPSAVCEYEKSQDNISKLIAPMLPYHNLMEHGYGSPIIRNGT